MKELLTLNVIPLVLMFIGKIPRTEQMQILGPAPWFQRVGTICPHLCSTDIFISVLMPGDNRATATSDLDSQFGASNEKFDRWGQRFYNPARSLQTISKKHEKLIMLF